MNTRYVPPKIFFTYVWGPPGEPAWPLTFASKASRTHALNRLGPGDLVFTVGTKRAETEPQYQGRVLAAYRVSTIQVNTQHYGLTSRSTDPQNDSVKRFPFALHPLEVEIITAADAMFSEVVGPLTRSHHLQAQTNIVELDAATAAPLLALSRKAVTIALPTNELASQNLKLKISKLAPKHSGSHLVTYGEHETWYVYTLELRQGSKPLAVKVGYAHDPKNRLDDYNKGMVPEVTGLTWVLASTQPTSNEDSARSVEQAVLAEFTTKRCASNGEILMKVDPSAVSVAIAKALARQKV